MISDDISKKSEAITYLIANVSHISYEMRTPLANILGFSNLLLQLSNTPQQELSEHELLSCEAIKSNSTKMLELLDEIVVLSRHLNNGEYIANDHNPE